MKHTQENCTITTEELEGLEKQAVAAVNPRDFVIVTETIENHYPNLIEGINSKRWNWGVVPSLFNQK